MNVRRVLPVLILLCSLPRFVAAVVVAPMTDAEWFAKSNKILVLEYESPLGGKEGAQLSQLLGWMALATASGIDRFAVVTLQQTEMHVELTDANVKSLAERQHAAVVIWGEFYQQAGRVFVTSHLRYAPELSRDSGRGLGPNAGKFSWNISQLNIPERAEAYASLPSSQINFSPIEISTADLSSLREVWRNTVIIRAEPDDNSAKQGELSLTTPYSVGETANGWTRVSTKERSGWVRWTDLSELSDFKDLTGVLHYAQGLMQYLTGNPNAAEETFKRYLAKYASRQDPMNKAIAHLFVGYSQMKGAADWAFSLNQFEKAKTLLPNASAPVNCTALVLFAKAARATLGENETLALEKDLIRVVQTENDVDAIRNLEILYRLPQAEPFFKKKSPNFLQARDTQLNVLRNLEQRVQRDPTAFVQATPPAPPAFAQATPPAHPLTKFEKLQDGDIVFIESNSENAKAIKELTKSNLTHCGIVFLERDGLHVREGAGRGEYLTLKEWQKRESPAGRLNPIFARRLTDRDKRLTSEIVQRLKNEARKLHETKYDKGFAWENAYVDGGEKKEYIYCSEFVWKAFDRAAQIHIGEPHPIDKYIREAKPEEVDSVKAIFAAKLNSNVSRPYRNGEDYKKDETVISPQEVFESNQLEPVTD